MNSNILGIMVVAAVLALAFAYLLIQEVVTFLADNPLVTLAMMLSNNHL